MRKNEKKEQTAELTNEKMLAQKFVKLACAEDTRAEVICNLCTIYGAEFAKGEQIQPHKLLKATYAAITLEVENSSVISTGDKIRVAENAKVAAKRCLYAALAVYKNGKLGLADIQELIKSVGFYKLWSKGTDLNSIKSTGKSKKSTKRKDAIQQPRVVETDGYGNEITDGNDWNSALALCEKIATFKLELCSKLAIVAELAELLGVTLDEVKSNEKPPKKAK